jgi:hypothetical protein
MLLNNFKHIMIKVEKNSVIDFGSYYAHFGLIMDTTNFVYYKPKTCITWVQSVSRATLFMLLCFWTTSQCMWKKLINFVIKSSIGCS